MNITRVKITCDDGTLFDSDQPTMPKDHLWHSIDAEPVLKLIWTDGGIKLALYRNQYSYTCVSLSGVMGQVEDVGMSRDPDDSEVSTFVLRANTESLLLMRGHPVLQQMASDAIEHD